MKPTAQIIQPLSHGLPKTRQETSYRTGDDGEHEIGWWHGLLNADNKTRFKVVTWHGYEGVIDRATGLMWPKNWDDVGANGGDIINWEGAIDYANNLALFQESDWRVPNAHELLTLLNWESASGLIPVPPFANVGGAYYWTSTTCAWLTTRAWVTRIDLGGVGFGLKTTEYNVVCVRTQK